MTSTDWKHFERLVAAIHHAESTGAEVMWDDVIAGRQFDVTVKFRYGLHTYLTVIECKNFSTKVPVEKVEAFITKSRDVLANKAIMVSANGFQSGCIEVAARHGVKLLVLTEVTDSSIEHLVKAVIPGLNIYDVRFHTTVSEKVYEMEDIGGRLAYLMNHARLASPVGEATPDQLIYEWQLSNPLMSNEKENDFELNLPANTELLIPHEESIPVSVMCFKCSMVDVFIPNQPIVDNHIRAGLATRVELRDAEGNLEHTAKLCDLKLGYDRLVESGKFYVLPSLHNHYYCDRIDEDVVHWVLVESYQYGLLIQAKLTQKLKYAGHYVEVTDERTLRRLRSMLEYLSREQR